MLNDNMLGPSPSPSDVELLARIGRSPGAKAGYKQLIRELGLGGGRERRLLRDQLTMLTSQGRLRASEGLWAIPQRGEADPKAPTSDKSTQTQGPSRLRNSQATFSASGRERFVTGRLDLHRDGFGFVRPEAPRSAGSAARDAGDLFIPPNALHGAMHGDLVLVEEDAPDRQGRRSGRIARVLTRRHPTLVGIFHYAGGRSGRRRAPREGGDPLLPPRGNYVQPWDDRLGGAIEIPEGAEILADLGESPHRTLDAKVLRADQSSLRSDGHDTEQRDRWPLEGLAVEVELTSFAQPGRAAQGRILEVLGHPDAFGVDVEIIIRKHAIPHTFPAPVLAEADERARETVASLPPAALAEREDFRTVPVITIDGETARDFDDGVYVRVLENGNTELQVHIADVSHYVQAASALDTEARVRGTSVYFPDRAVPMLPHALSSGVCSLLPHEDRLVLSCIMEIDARGEIVGYRVGEGLMRSARRMTYTSVQHCLNAAPAAAGWNAHASITLPAAAEDQVERERVGLEQPEIPAALDRMLELALRLNAKRVRRGSIDFDLPEPVVAFDPDGNMQAIVRSERGWAHRLIEEFMLSANECVATWLTAQGAPSIYRIHEVPDPKRILDFEETAAAFGQTLGLGALPVKRLTMKTDRREAQRRSERGRGGRAAPAQELPERVPVTPQMYQRLVRRIAGKPEERILSYLMLRSLKQARYAEQNEGHFALASPCYTHFTSPIRRYPDLIVHRLVRALLQSGADPRGGAILSSDPQPWKADQGRLARAAAGTAPRVQAFRRPAEAPAREALEGAAEGKRRRRPAGRIGWSGEGEAGRSRALDEESIFVEPDQALERGEGVVSAQTGLLSAQELADIAVESSQAERRAAEAERELIEWKKMKFMADKVGDHFRGLILSVTKFGFFVELDELFIDGLVPLGSLVGDFYSYRDADRAICGARTGHCFRVGDRVEVMLDRIDRQQRRLQFALVPGTEPKAASGTGSLRKGKSGEKKARAEAKRAALGKEKAHKRKLRKR